MELNELKVKLPYNLEVPQLVPEPGTRLSNCHDELRGLANPVHGYTEDELRRIFLSTALLLHVHPSVSVGQALHTAQIWERG